MENQPLVSIIVPCYNMEPYLADTIVSVQRQTYPNWELLLVDDVSTDGTVSVVESFCKEDTRILLTVKEQHTSIAASRNQAIGMAKGRYLAFLDADDLWRPEKLERQLALMQAQQVGFTYTSYDLIDEQGKPLGKTIQTAGDLTYNAYLRNTIIGCSTVMIDTALVGPVTVPDFRTSEDTATWLDILRKGFVAYAIDEPLVSYRIRKNSASSNKFKAAADLWKVYRQHERLPFFRAAAFFCSYAFHALKKHLF